LGTVCGAGVKTGMYLFGSKGAEAKWSEYLGTSVALGARVNLRCGVSLEGGRTSANQHKLMLPYITHVKPRDASRGLMRRL
jgi:hypothetical protein